MGCKSSKEIPTQNSEINPERCLKQMLKRTRTDLFELTVRAYQVGGSKARSFIVKRRGD